MTDGDTVFAADGSHIGQIETLDEKMMRVRGSDHSYRVPRAEVDFETEARIFLRAPNRAAAHLWRVDVEAARGLRGWWQRRVLGPSPHRPGGHLDD